MAVRPPVEAVIIDRAAAAAGATFESYAADTFLPYLKMQLKDATQVDIIWDRYFPDSLKGVARMQRGTGRHRHVDASPCVPLN